MSITEMYFLFTYFTELYYFIMHFNFHKGNSLFFFEKITYPTPFLSDPHPYSYTTPFYENFFIPPPYCDFWVALSPP